MQQPRILSKRYHALNFYLYGVEIIGRSAYIYFPDFSDQGIPAKIDTGAYRSALYGEVLEERGKQLLVRAYFLSLEHPPEIWLPGIRKKNIISSNGQSQERWLVRIRLKLGQFEGVAECSLANREGLTFPVLVGRRLLRNRFLVDVSKNQLQP